MNKHQELYLMIKRIEDAKDYVERTMTTDLSHVDEYMLDKAAKHVEELFFLLEPIARKRYVVNEIKGESIRV